MTERQSTEENIEGSKSYTDSENFMKKNKILGILTQRDLLYATILGVMGGIISSLPLSDIMKLIYPFVGGQQLLSGHHLLWMAISYGITKKKMAPIITAFVKGILESFFNNWGAFILIMDLVEGLSIVAGFWIIEKFGEGKTKLGWAIAGGIGNFVQAPIFWWLNGRFAVVNFTLAIIAFIFAFLSGCFISGLLGRQIVIGLKKSLGD